MKLASGFSLLELMVTVAVAGMLTVAMYVAFDQVKKSTLNIDRVIESDEALLLFYNQLDKDISSAFVPNIVYAKATENLREKFQKEQPKDNSTNAGLGPQSSASVMSLESSKSKIPKIENIFFYNSKNSNTLRNKLDTLSFISTNSLTSYGKATARIARITYTLLADSVNSKNKESYKLVRQENQDINWSGQPKNSRSYEIINRIKDLKVSFILQEKPDEKEKDKDKIKFVTLNSWPKDHLEKYGRYLPQYIRFEGERWDSKYNDTVPFEFEYKILSDSKELLIEKQIKDIAQKLEQLFKTESSGQSANVAKK